MRVEFFAGPIYGARVAGDAFDPSARVGDSVTIRGAAWDGAAGALVMVDGTPIYVDGLEAWPDGLADRQVEVTGTLRSRASQVPEPDEDDDDDPFPLHGVDSETYVIDDARWAAV